MLQSGLLILTSPLSKVQARVPHLLKLAAEVVEKTLYVHIQPNTSKVAHLKPCFHMKTLPVTTELQKLVTSIYTSNATICTKLDVHVLLGHFTNIDSAPLPNYCIPNCDALLLDSIQWLQNPNLFDQNEFAQNVKACFNIDSNPEVIILKEINDNDETVETSKDTSSMQTYDNVVLGGTFDRPHIGHKILLSESCLQSNHTITVGVTEGVMNSKKVLWELMQPLSQRIINVQRFIESIKPSLQHKVVPIQDPFGPSTVDERLQAIVVSQETQRGGQMVNDERAKKGLSQLDIHVIELVEDANHSVDEETKISSSSSRKRLLGTLIRDVQVNRSIPAVPYRIGLTGGVASGKSSICKRLQNLGLGVVDCDKLGHQAYVKGSPAFQKVVDAFGSDVIGSDGEINRKVLSSKVFGNKAELDKLCSIVWPEIMRLAEIKIKELADAGCQFVVMEAAVLLEAGWDGMVHEVWVAIIPQQEAVRRMMERDSVSEKDALARLSSQLSNSERVAKANVVLSSLWEYEVTQKQVEKAWSNLKKRTGKSNL